MMLMLKSSQSLARKAMFQSSLLVSQHSTRHSSFISGAMMHNPAKAGAVNPLTTISAVYAVFMGTVIFHVVNEATATTASR
jgi:hypothetical protein